MGGMGSKSKRGQEHEERGTRKESKAKRAGAGFLKLFTYWWLFCLFAAFALLLAATAALQNDCGENGTNVLWGNTGFFAPTECSKFWRYPWWITFYTLFVFLIILIMVAINKVHMFRAALIGLLAILTMLLMDGTNTFFGAKEIAEDDILAQEAEDRARVWMAGGIIGAVASFFLIMLLGIHDETTATEERPYYEKRGGREERTPERTTTTTTPGTTTAPESYPASAV